MEKRSLERGYENSRATSKQGRTGETEKYFLASGAQFGIELGYCQIEIAKGVWSETKKTPPPLTQGSV